MSTIQTARVNGTQIELLTRDNYFTWRDRARAILKDAKKWKYVDPVRKDKNEKLSSDELDEYEASKDYLSLLISFEVWEDFKNKASAPDIWTALDDHFTRIASKQESVLLSTLEATHFDEKKEDMGTYINRISRLVGEVKAHGGQMSASAITGYYLRGLPAEYEAIATYANLRRDDPEEVKISLLREEARQKERAFLQKRVDPAPHALVANRAQDRQTNKRTCYHCGKEGHIRRDCRALKAKQRAEGKKKERDSSGTKSDLRTTSADEPKLNLMIYKGVDNFKQSAWYLDSGATDHITGTRDAFTSFMSITPPISMRLGDESTVLCTGKGEVELTLDNGKDIVFTDVLYCKDFKGTSLLSVSYEPGNARAGCSPLPVVTLAASLVGVSQAESPYVVTVGLKGFYRGQGQVQWRPEPGRARASGPESELNWRGLDRIGRGVLVKRQYRCDYTIQRKPLLITSDSTSGSGTSSDTVSSESRDNGVLNSTLSPGRFIISAHRTPLGNPPAIGLNFSFKPAIVIIAKVAKALDEVDGAGKHYREVVTFLESLKHTLEPLQTFTALNTYPSYGDEIQKQVRRIKLPIQRFLEAAKKFESSLGASSQDSRRRNIVTILSSVCKIDVHISDIQSSGTGINSVKSIGTSLQPEDNLQVPNPTGLVTAPAVTVGHQIKQRPSDDFNVADIVYFKRVDRQRLDHLLSKLSPSAISLVSFLFIVNEMPTNDNLEMPGGIPPRYIDNRWRPPGIAEGFLAQVPGHVYRWRNGVVSLADNYQWTAQQIGTPVYTNGTVYGLDGKEVIWPEYYRAATVFYCNCFDEFLTAKGDAGTRDIWTCTDPEDWWHQLSFFHRANVSYVDHFGDEESLAMRQASWIGQLLTHVYRRDLSAGPELDGLAGLLSIIINLIAFSCQNSNELYNVLINDRSWRLQNWFPHKRPNISGRGVVTTVFTDPENPQGSTFPILRDFEEGNAIFL
ncbi:hypothetical protein G7Y89_g7137 [Cudoniella acicularis]|uniref:CCHC-type domain-containing protein n=1 Tax=Cudoniella acicularis TaxID=354080 RepID=A0A8H4RLD9_9HELO|nr:hypothetical protein G7Y89_g7137 [Cudoniella acicularis]